MMGRRVAELGGLALAVAALATGCTLSSLWEPTEEQVLERILPSAVQIVLEHPEGRRFRTSSGVIVGAREAGRECFVLTAAHTFSGAHGKAVYVIFGSHAGGGAKADARVLAQRETDTVDLALLQASSEGCSSARLKRRPVLGEWVWVVAFPWGHRLTLARGIVSQVEIDREASRPRTTRLMVDASVSYGASGAGVFEARTGGLIGVVQGYSTARVSSHGSGSPWYIDVPVPGQTFVMSLRQIRSFLEETGYAALLGDRSS
jgi:S1-C subfamily serine protease